MNTKHKNVAQKSLLNFAGKLKYQCFVISFSHSNYLISLGGTEKVLHEEQAEFEKRGISYVQVHACLSRDEGWWKESPDQLVGVNVDSMSVGNYTLIQLTSVFHLLQETHAAHPIALHIHHLMNLSVTGLKHLLDTLQIQKTRVFLHDYYTICPQFNLLRNDRFYCHVDCKDCASKQFRTEHFSVMKRFFEDIEAEFVAPSQIAADIWQKSFPEHAEKIRLVPHQICLNRNAGSLHSNIESSNFRPKIAYLGYEQVNKGKETWSAMVLNENLKGKYNFFHLGAVGLKLPGVTFVPVSFLEKGPNAMVNALRKNQIDIAFLWSIWPETYSFTLYEAFAANCFVITNKISGNIMIQVRNTERGVVCADKSELFRLLNDEDMVKGMLHNHYSRNRRIELSFNSQLVKESAKNMRSAEYFPYLNPSGIKRLQNSSLSWNRLMGSIETETIRAEHIKNMVKHLQTLEKKLAKTNQHAIEYGLPTLEQCQPNYFEGPYHPVFDQIIRFLRRHPMLKHLAMSVLDTAWRITSKLKILTNS